MTIYLDFNATTPIDDRVLEEMIFTYQNNFGNSGSRTHVYGRKANELVEQARREIAAVLDIDSNEVIFTSGATESNNLVLLGLAKWGITQARTHIISSQIEHKAILEPLDHLKSLGFEIDLVPVDSSGRVDSNEIIKLIRPETLLVSLMHVNNETGIIQPVKQIGEYLSTTKTFFHVDAAQSFGKNVIELKEVMYDFLSISAHKIYGPQGIGALVTRRRDYQLPPLSPIIFGGGQEYGLRPGTLPVPLIVGFGKAANLALKEHSIRERKNLALKEKILDQLTKVPHIINGNQEFCSATTINVSFPGIDSEALMLFLEDDIAISNGSACTSKDYKPSHVLISMGLEKPLVESSVRISWGHLIEDVNLQPLIEFVNDFSSCS